MLIVPFLCEFYVGICLTTEEKARKNLSQVKKNLSQSTIYILPKHPYITNPPPHHTHPHTHTHTHTHIHTHLKFHKTRGLVLHSLLVPFEMKGVCGRLFVAYLGSGNNSGGSEQYDYGGGVYQGKCANIVCSAADTFNHTVRILDLRSSSNQ
jgi:hypothetical protein